MKNIPSYLNFDSANYKWKNTIDYRKNPNKYRVGKGEQGVLICEPYKTEILPFWKFKDRYKAAESSDRIYQLFLEYLDKNDFVGADMARKYLQMGFTRARRYANYKAGRKYSKQDYHLLEKFTGDPEKIISAEIFYKKWQQAEDHSKYAKMKIEWKKEFG